MTVINVAHALWQEPSLKEIIFELGKKIYLYDVRFIWGHQYTWEVEEKDLSG